MFSYAELDILRLRLESRFNIKLHVDNENIDGGWFPVVRPDGIEKGSGFGVVVARTHRQVEASFCADNFAGALLNRMSQADASVRRTFLSLVTAASEKNAQVYISINEGGVAPWPPEGAVWRRIELDVQSRIGPGKPSSEQILNAAIEVCSSCLSLALSLIQADESYDGGGDQFMALPEGALTRVLVNRYERQPANRAACIAHYGTICQVCKLDFSDVYGVVGAGYIEVHHRVPVSKMGPDYFVNPVEDLVPLCANCHAMVHRTNPPMSIESLRAIFADKAKARIAPFPV